MAGNADKFIDKASARRRVSVFLCHDLVVRSLGYEFASTAKFISRMGHSFDCRWYTVSLDATVSSNPTYFPVTPTNLKPFSFPQDIPDE